MAFDETTFTKRVEKWQSAEPGELAPNFHSLKAVNGNLLDQQFVTVDSWDLTDLAELQNSDIEAMFLWMALDDFQKSTISFEPILEVETTTGTRKFLEFNDNVFQNLGQTEPVPTPFVNNTRAVWRKLEPEKIAEAFTNRNPKGSERVRYFKIEGVGLDWIKALLPYAIGFRILPGIDLNKATDDMEVTFVPIINITVPTISATGMTEAHGQNLHGFGWTVLEEGDDEVYFDYSRPCPPVCNNH